MADRKISELTNLTGANLADDDEFPLVDTSADETKAITFGEFKTALDTATGFVRITGDTMTGNLSMGDNVKAIFGAGPELQIYSDGTSGIIKDVGSGDIKILADDFYVQNAAGSSTLISVLDTGKVGLGFAGSEKLATESGGVNITGTLTSDGLETLHTSGDVGYRLGYNSGSSAYIHRDSATGHYLLQSDETGSSWKIETDNGSGPLTRLEVDRYGDISFYEDTGSTPKFFWDASAESLGIGTSSPTTALTITESTVGDLITVTGANGTDLRIGNHASANGGIYINSQAASDDLRFRTQGSDRMTITSAGNVGIGTSSPTQKLQVSGGSFLQQQSGATNNTAPAAVTVSNLTTGSHAAGLGASILFTHVNSGGGYNGPKISSISNADPFTSNLVFYSHNYSHSEAMRITSSGSVGIGTSSPSANLEIAQSGNNVGLLVAGGGYNYTAKFESSDAEANIIIEDSNSTNDGNMIGVATNDMYFITNASERMRIDSSGNLLVGKTTQGLTNAGFEVAQSGQASATQSGASALRLNRLSSDGEILQFRKDGSTVGSIGTVSAAGDLYISSSDTDHAGLRFSYERILPYRNGTLSDGTVDLGQTSDNYRFKDLYLSGGVFLGGTGAANKLYDYEEGGWTPSFGNTGGVTYDQQSGRYTKIGRAVHIQGVIRWSAFTPSSNVFLGGLPFTPEGSDNFINSVSVFPANGTAYNVAYEYLSGGSLFFYNNSGSLGGSAASNPFGSSGSIIINGIYYA